MNHQLVIPRGGRPAARLPATEPGDPREFHRTLPGYRTTPLLRLPSIAERLRVAEVIIKDESERLGLPAFKMLGASWATARAVHREWMADDVPLRTEALRLALSSGPRRRLVAATDGNHGRGVARMAALLGLACDIFMPEGTAASRIVDIEAEGATVTVVPGSYDDAIRVSAEEADDDTLIVSDTSWPGYTRTPTDVIQGYSTMFREIDDALGARPTHLALQSGVGSFAAAGIAHYREQSAHRPFVVIVEPTEANCLMRSAQAGFITEAPGPHRSTMAGLNCGLPSALAWPVVYGGADAYVSVDDDYAHLAMRLLAENGVVSGESGSAGLAGFLATADTDDRSALNLDADSVVLLVNTEGATDPVNYERQVGHPPTSTVRS
ncbi:diaminopropionate ammonia-lyase [uncultured Microbacterium sp.]|uniref:diaminopropionate ammonia-lyase n=1 Tax=uncultured Microbacterium sp. TaxID=191216 RepID=UPI0035CA6FE0